MSRFIRMLNAKCPVGGTVDNWHINSILERVTFKIIH